MDGPADWITCAEPKNKPVPIAPPIAMSWIWRFLVHAEVEKNRCSKKTELDDE